jgi:eukaryotic-like serine/threonine-protein kinase
MTGTTLGHYQILEKLGEGGMGVVYKARDTHLDRFVAVKVLPPQAVADPDRKRRFIQEARAASALNHPNIVTIHDIAQQDGVDYMVMEYVDGKTLSALIGRKGMPLDEFLPVAIQSADGLARAHANGIIHRDIKPGNIMVTRDGKAKVLDFGLAKLMERSAGIGEEAATRTQGHTGEGAILGTAAYMSPEQAQGKDLDNRSDIFSFGAVLHEMLTGEPVFRRENGVSTLSAVLRDEPKTIGDNLPRELDRIVRQCLRKQPQRRFQHMDDVKVELENLKEDADSGRMAALPSPVVAANISWSRWALISVPMLLLAGAVVWYFARPSPVQTAAGRRPAMRRLTADSGLTTQPALSPDGKWVAYASDRESEGNLDIWVQQIATGERRKLTSDGADEHEPSFAPDSSRVAYRSEQDGGGIYLVSILGGEPKRVVRAGRRPKFSPDGTRLAYWVGGFGSNSRLEGRSRADPAGVV